MDTQTKTVYWHRELPPFDAEVIGEHTLEASSPLSGLKTMTVLMSHPRVGLPKSAMRRREWRSQTPIRPSSVTAPSMLPSGLYATSRISPVSPCRCPTNAD